MFSSQQTKKGTKTQYCYVFYWSDFLSTNTRKGKQGERERGKKRRKKFHSLALGGAEKGSNTLSVFSTTVAVAIPQPIHMVCKP